MWIDIHAHLYDKSERELVLCLEKARSNKIDIIINTSTSIETAQKVLSQCKKDISLYGAAGISPFDVEQLTDNWKNDLKAFLNKEMIIGIGEIGLDNTNPAYPPFKKQISVFEQQLEIAQLNNMPAVIHSRGAEKETISLCKNQHISKAVFHCFTGDKESLEQILDAGYYVSYSGIITFKNNPIEDLVRITPLEQMFIETDSPYLSPHPYRGKPNEPANVAIVGEKIAEIKDIPKEKAAETIRHNFLTLFNIFVSD